MKKFDDYQNKIIEFMNPRVLESSDATLDNAILGLCGESGECADIIKKFRHHEKELNLEKLDLEVGDVIFYCALYALARKRNLSDIAQMNIDKLTKRYGGNEWSAEAANNKIDEIMR